VSGGREPADAAWLEDGEDILMVLQGDGARLLATSWRVVIVRDGSGFRPRSGVRSWPYEQVERVSLVQPKRNQARILIRTGDPMSETVSMFFEARHWTDAEHLANEIRRRQPSRPW
jgi:hypothetical protein